MTELDVLRSDRVLTVVRAERIPDAADLCHALAAGGIRTVELTFTTPGVLDHLHLGARHLRGRRLHRARIDQPVAASRQPQRRHRQRRQ